MTGSLIYMGLYLVTLVIIEPQVAFAWGVGGVLAFAWFNKSNLVFGLALVTGLVIDLYWGRSLGSSSLVLLLLAAGAMMIHELFSQWWVLAIMAGAAGFVWSVWFYGQILLMPILGCVLAALSWYGICWYTFGKRRGVYLKR